MSLVRWARGVVFSFLLCLLIFRCFSEASSKIGKMGGGRGGGEDV